MEGRRKFELVIAPETLDHLDAIEREHYGLIQRTAEEVHILAIGVKERNRLFIGGKEYTS